MAAKNRRTKGKNWKDSSNDDTSDDDDLSFTTKKFQNISFTKREKEREMKRTKKVLNELCDSDDESDTEQTRSRPISSLPITITKKYSKPSVSSDSDNSDSNLNRSAGRHSKISKVSVTSKKQINKNKNSSSESIVEYKGSASGRKRKLDSEEKNNIDVNQKIKTNQHNSDTSSSKEFQKPKAKKRKKSWTRLSKEYIQDDYSVISTPSKSDDESIRVEMKQEISLKHHIFEEIEKIKNVMADLISDLDIQSNYLLKKKVNVLSDSKFIAHKILRIYDGTYEKIKENKNNFAEMYKSWIDTCSNRRSSVYIPSKNLYSSFSDEIQETPNHTTKEKNQDKRTSKSFEKDRKSDSSDDKFDTSEENKDIQKKHLDLKKKISDDNRLKNSSTSNEDDDSNNLDKTKKSKDSKDKRTSKSFEKDRKSDSSDNKSDTSEENKDIQKKHLDLKKKISDDNRLKNSSTSNEDDDSNNLDKTKKSKDSKDKRTSKSFKKDRKSDSSDNKSDTSEENKDIQKKHLDLKKKISDDNRLKNSSTSNEDDDSNNLDKTKKSKDSKDKRTSKSFKKDRKSDSSDNKSDTSEENKDIQKKHLDLKKKISDDNRLKNSSTSDEDDDSNNLDKTKKSKDSKDKRTSKSFKKDRKSDSSDNKSDTSEENKDIQKKHLGLKKKVSDDSRLKNSSTSNEDDDSNNLDKTKKSKDSNDKRTSKSFEKDRKSDSSDNKSDTSEENKDIQKKHLDLKKKISDDNRLKNSSTSDEDDDSNNLDKTKKSKDSKDKRTSKSFKKDRKSDSSDNKSDTSEENKDIQKKHLGLKKKVSDDSRLKNSSTSNEDDDSNNLDKTKKSKDSNDKRTSKSFKKDRKSDSSDNKSDTSEENKDIQKKHLGLKKKISDDSRLKNSSTSNEDDDSNNLDKTKQSKDSKTKHASSKDNNSDNSDMIVETNDVQNGNSGSEKKSDIHKNLSTKSSDENENSDNLDKENDDKQNKIKHNDKQKTSTEGIGNDQSDKHKNSSTKSSTEDENSDNLDEGEENDNRQKKNDKTVIDNLSKASTLSASNLQDSIVSNNSVAGEDDILNPEKNDENMLSVSQRVPRVDDDKSQKSLCKEKNLSEPLNENDSMDKVSDCDSDEIFSGDEVRSKRSNKESKTTEEDDSKTEKSKELKKDLKESKDDSCSSNSEVLFETTASEIGSTPVKSPILGSKSRSLRNTLLTTTKPVIDSDLQKSIAFKEDIEPKAIQANSASEDSEREAMKSLLRDSDSDDSTSPVNKENESDADSEISVDSSCSNDNIDKKKEASKKPLPRKSNNLLKKKKKLIIQTKNENSISSDSSSNSGEESNRKKKSSSLEHSAKLTSSRRRQQAFNVQKNRHYKADKKLRMTCRVTLERLSESVLEKYSRALEKSKKNVANKKFNSITNLDGLETKRKSRKTLEAEKSSPSDSTETSSTKAKKKKSVKNNLDEKNESVSELDSTEELDKSVEKKISDNVPIEQEIVKEYENKAKEALLNSLSSSSNENEEAMEVDESNCKKSKKSKAKNGKKNNSDEEASDVKSEDDKVSSSDENDEKKEKGKWKNDKLLTFQITDTESEKEKFNKSQEKRKLKEENDKNLDEEVFSNNEKTPVKAKKKRPQRKMRRILDSDSDAVIDSSDDKSVVSVDASDSEEEKEEKKEKKKKRGRKRQKSSDSDSSSSDKKQKSKRKRIKKVTSESDSDDQDSPGKGRKNIRKVLKDKHVADDTKKAAQDEEHRLKRIAERQRLFNEMYDARLAGEAKVDKLVLDFDEETKKELVVVDKQLVKRLKPHQAQGIKFMWDACFESLKQIKESEGSGCIIAHCMGLGKTFQVVTLTHTLLTHEETGVKTVMVVCPLSTVLNWVNEFKIWLKHVKNGDDIEIYELTKMKKNFERKYQLQSWQRTGGVLIIGYEMYRNLVSTGKKMRKAMQESIMRSLVDPGADLVVCDEGHLLKNEESALSKAMKLVKTMRRIVLTGTPLQNNLKEYHCMVQFVKPNLLGTKKEFLNRFVNPITNGQFEDSTTNDVKLMKKRAHVLHKMLEGSVQRFDYSVLMPFLPPKQEYVIFVRLTEVQIKMYQYYLDNFARRFGQRNGSLFADFQELQRIWTHPYVLRLNAEKVEKANEKKRLEASDSEGSLKDFIDDNSESETSLSSSPESDNSDIQCIDSDGKKPILKITRSTRLNPKEEPEDVVPTTEESAEEAAWWSKFVEEKHFEDLRISTKLILLFGILKESEQIGDKVLVFSQSLYSLTLIEQFLNLIDQETQNGEEAEHLDKHSGTWSLGLDYFRLDGSTSAENRSAWCKIFNNPTNTRARLFLISTRAGGLGINLTAANRVIIFDASWNPSHDVQSIFRIYRFGQKKPCYVYRFLAAGTMEEKIYNRQVTKLSLSCRVVDEQQIERHFSNNDLAELYQFESYEDKSTVLALPKDRLLAEIFLKYKDAVYTYHEHDSLLENKQEEELDEEERKQAWQEYEDEKQGKRQMVNMGNNMMLNPLPNSFPELESIKLLIQKDYPNLPPEHLEQVARQAVFDMYRFVDQQAVNQTLNPFGLGQQMHAANMLVPPAMQQQQQFNPQSQLLNMLSQPQMNYPAVNHMPVYSGRGRPPKHMSMNNPMTNMIPVQQPMQFQQTPMQAMNKNDEVEIITEEEATPPHVDIASNSNNIQEE